MAIQCNMCILRNYAASVGYTIGLQSTVGTKVSTAEANAGVLLILDQLEAQILLVLSIL